MRDMILKLLSFTLVFVSAPIHAAPLPPAQREAVEQAVQQKLRDPASAQFKHFDSMDKDGAYCGLVNSKNGFGGFTGMKPFLVLIKPGMSPGEFSQLTQEAQESLRFLANPKVMVVSIASDNASTSANYIQCKRYGYEFQE